VISRRLLALLLAALCAVAAPASAQDNAGNGEDNSAVAINTKDGASVFKLAFAVDKAVGEVVDNQNAAVAYSSCTGCRTIAIAIQVVLVMGDPNVVTPENLAIAINENCTACETFAFAAQILINTGSQFVRLTGAGHRRLKDIRKALRELGTSDLPFDQLAAELKALTAELKDVFATELEPVPRRDDEDEQEPEATPTAEPTEEASPTPSSEPAQEASPTAEPTPEPTATTEPEPTPTAEPTP
jgi:putative peptide zinc metalloprotease protein